MFYEKNKDNQFAEYREIIKEINMLYSEIAQNQEKIKQIKGVVKCPQCGADVPLNASFCNACGARIEQKTVADINDDRQCYCPICHAVVDPDDSFCNHCGAKIENS